MALKPWVIDWRSNHSLLEMNSLPLGKGSIQSLDPDIILTDHCFFAWTKEFNDFTGVAEQIYCGIQCTAVFTLSREMSLVGLKQKQQIFSHE